SVDARKTTVRDSFARLTLEALAIGQWEVVRAERLEECFGALVHATDRMEPERRFAFAVWVRHALTEANLALRDERATAPALRAAGRRCLEEVRHRKPHELRALLLALVRDLEPGQATVLDYHRTQPREVRSATAGPDLLHPVPHDNSGACNDASCRP